MRHMGKALGLYNPRELVRKLDLQGRTDAGFGAWKAEKPTIVQPVDSSKRCVLDAMSSHRLAPARNRPSLVGPWTGCLMAK